MVVEAVGGGWGHQARTVFSELAKLTAAASGELTSESECGVMLARRLSSVLHRENAGSILRRPCGGQVGPSPEQLSVLASLSEEQFS